MKVRKTWYDKIILDDNLSLRYYYIFDDRKHLEGKWVIKDHSNRKYTEISEQAARMICESHDIDFDKDREEVIGRNIGTDDDIQVYRKVILDGEIKIIFESDAETRVFNFIDRSECGDAADVEEEDEDDDDEDIEIEGVRNLIEIIELLKRI